MDPKNKVTLCLAGNLALLGTVITTMCVFAGDSKYFRWGPHDDFVVISVTIDTMVRYYILLIMIAFIKITKVMIEEIGMPVLSFSIYNPDKKVITEFTKNELQFFGNAMYLVSSIRTVFEIMVTITQIDIALISVIFTELASLFTIRMLLNEKEFTKGQDKKLLNVAGDITNINEYEPLV